MTETMPNSIAVFLEGLSLGSLESGVFSFLEMGSAADAVRLEQGLLTALEIDAGDRLLVARWASEGECDPPGESGVIVYAVRIPLPPDTNGIGRLAKRIAAGKVPVAYIARCRSAEEIGPAVTAIVHLLANQQSQDAVRTSLQPLAQ